MSKFRRLPFNYAAESAAHINNTMKTCIEKKYIVINRQTLNHTFCFRQKWILISP